MISPLVHILAVYLQVTNNVINSQSLQHGVTTYSATYTWPSIVILSLCIGWLIKSKTKSYKKEHYCFWPLIFIVISLMSFNASPGLSWAKFQIIHPLNSVNAFSIFSRDCFLLSKIHVDTKRCSKNTLLKPWLFMYNLELTSEFYSKETEHLWHIFIIIEENNSGGEWCLYIAWTRLTLCALFHTCLLWVHPGWARNELKSEVFFLQQLQNFILGK